MMNATSGTEVLRLAILAVLSSVVLGVSTAAIDVGPSSEANTPQEIALAFLLGLIPGLGSAFLWLQAVRVHSLRITLVGGILLAVSIAIGPFFIQLLLAVSVTAIALWAAASRGTKTLGILGPLAAGVTALILSYPIAEGTADAFSYPVRVYVGFSVLTLLFMLPEAIAVLFGSGGNEVRGGTPVQSGRRG